MLVRTRAFHPVLDQRFDRAFGQRSASLFAPARRTPTVEGTWNDGSLELTVDLPGTPRDAIDVSVSGKAVTIGVTTEQSSWTRTVRVAQDIDADQVAATYLDGRLTVTVSPVPAAEPRRVEVTTPVAAAVSAGTPDATDVPEVAQSENGTSDNG